MSCSARPLLALTASSNWRVWPGPPPLRRPRSRRAGGAFDGAHLDRALALAGAPKRSAADSVGPRIVSRGRAATLDLLAAAAAQTNGRARPRHPAGAHSPRGSRSGSRRATRSRTAGSRRAGSASTVREAAGSTAPRRFFEQRLSCSSRRARWGRRSGSARRRSPRLRARRRPALVSRGIECKSKPCARAVALLRRSTLRTDVAGRTVGSSPAVPTRRCRALRRCCTDTPARRAKRRAAGSRHRRGYLTVAPMTTRPNPKRGRPLSRGDSLPFAVMQTVQGAFAGPHAACAECCSARCAPRDAPGAALARSRSQLADRSRASSVGPRRPRRCARLKRETHAPIPRVLYAAANSTPHRDDATLGLRPFGAVRRSLHPRLPGARRHWRCSAVPRRGSTASSSIPGLGTATGPGAGCGSARRAPPRSLSALCSPRRRDRARTAPPSRVTGARRARSRRELALSTRDPRPSPAGIPALSVLTRARFGRDLPPPLRAMRSSLSMAFAVLLGCRLFDDPGRLAP